VGFGVVFFLDILYLEVNKDFTDCKQCLLVMSSQLTKISLRYYLVTK